ncbi:non-homologous end joining protein Ku [Amycolatopsis sp. H20-H5]|uniref:non-homologous end joining protein Ku n=1 Tax=Amycolatopsis sp. H20-H5 TaxID=3046309 RepID=UPI002DBCAB46|nr:Ku protein [Amycolatopsis sp. H20-H5]MEC3981488.1 Ku protein [Amycolatopsis sp. H20-H5]
MRAMWKGSVSFGLVTIPIQLYAATENKNVALRQVHEADGGRIQYKRFCSVDGTEVPYAEIAKGYELPGGEMVVITDADLAELPLVSSRTIDVLEFVPLESIDPINFDKTYYLEPQKAAVKPYVVLRDALHKASHVAIAKVAIRQREALAVLRVHNDVLMMTTMLWPDEVRVPDFAFLREDPPQVRPQEVTMAGSLIDSLSEPVFEPEKYSDSYREALEALIETKAGGGETAKPGPTGAKADVVDLMAALQASVSAAKKTRKPATTRKPAARKPAEDTAAPKAAKKPTVARRTPKSA